MIFALRLLPVAATLATLHAGTESAAPSGDKWQYNLFNPTPDDLMRPMSTDRPDTTESPITVDAGHLQIESTLFDYGRNDDGSFEEEVFTYGTMNVKFGLLNNIDLQIVFDCYTEVENKDKATGITDTVDGFSDVQVRLKINSWGNDGGKTALAFFPFIKIPTGTALSNDKVEGGLIMPFSLELNETMSLGLMPEVDFVRQDIGDGYDAEFVHTAVLGFDVMNQVGGFVEYVGVAGSDSGFDYQASAVVGVTYGYSDNIQFDTGMRFGLNKAAEDLGLFVGLSTRF